MDDDRGLGVLLILLALAIVLIGGVRLLRRGGLSALDPRTTAGGRSPGALLRLAGGAVLTLAVLGFGILLAAPPRHTEQLQVIGRYERAVTDSRTVRAHYYIRTANHGTFRTTGAIYARLRPDADYTCTVDTFFVRDIESCS